MNNEVAAIVEKTGLSTEKVEEILKAAIDGADFSDLSEEEAKCLDTLNEEGVLDWEWVEFSCGAQCCGFSHVEKKIKGPKGMVTIE